MNAEESTDATIDALKARLRPAFDGFLREVRDEVRDEIGIPVQRSGSAVVRSKPGEAPRKDSGDYSASWETDSLEHADGIEGHVFTNSKIGGFLINGTERMEPRPHAAKAAARARQDGGARIQAKL